MGVFHGWKCCPSACINLVLVDILLIKKEEMISSVKYHWFALNAWQFEAMEWFPGFGLTVKVLGTRCWGQ